LRFAEQRGLLLSYELKNAEFIAPVFRNVDKDGQFTLLHGRRFAPLRSTAKVKPGDHRSPWKAMLDPKWSNQISVGHRVLLRASSGLGRADEEAVRFGAISRLGELNPQIGRSIIDTVTTTVIG